MPAPVLLGPMLAATLAQSPPNDLDAALAMLDQLDSTVVAAEFDRVPLTQALNDLGNKVPVPLRVDWPAIERLGINEEDQITLRIDRVNATSALASLAFCLGDELERPIFEPHAGQMVLTTVDGSAAMRLTSAYDVRDLLANAALVEQLRTRRPPRDVGEEPIDQPVDAGDNDEHPPALPDAHPIPKPLAPPPGHEPPQREIAQPPDPAVDGDTPQREPTSGEQLLWLITDHVDPDAWLNYGGNRALVTDIDGVLMVTAPPTTHRMLREALRQLRQANPSSLAVDSILIDIPRAAYERHARQNDRASAAFALALRSDKDATTLWRADQALAMDGELSTKSRSGDTEVQVTLKPQFDATRGLLTLKVIASTTAGASDQRHVETALTINPSQSCAVVELPAAHSSDTMRLIVVNVSRR